MKPETIKATMKKIDWIVCKDFNLPRMPMSQGLLIKHLIEHYKIPFKQVGYFQDIVGIRTKRQTMLWKDTGIGARFLGIVNEDGSVAQHEDDDKPQHKVFNSFEEMNKEIEEREYDNILGFKAKITEDRYYDALEALPPFKYTKTGFILSEALSDNLYYHFFLEGKQYYVEVVKLEDEEVMRIENMR